MIFIIKISLHINQKFEFFYRSEISESKDQIRN
jgi:hypothetical protein